MKNPDLEKELTAFLRALDAIGADAIVQEVCQGLTPRECWDLTQRYERVREVAKRRPKAPSITAAKPARKTTAR